LRLPPIRLRSGQAARNDERRGVKNIFYFSCLFTEVCGIVSIGEVYSFISQEYGSNKWIMRDISLRARKRAKEMF
jgi:hypothetical protein